MNGDCYDRMDHRRACVFGGSGRGLSFFWVPRLVDRKLEHFQSDLMDRHYDEVENMYRTMRGWRHDYHNHIQAMKA